MKINNFIFKVLDLSRTQDLSLRLNVLCILYNKLYLNNIGNSVTVNAAKMHSKTMCDHCIFNGNLYNPPHQPK